jgi:hypothetical protein
MTHTPDNDPDGLLGFEDLISDGADPADARAVLGPHSALSRREIEDRLEMLRRERLWEGDA